MLSICRHIKTNGVRCKATAPRVPVPCSPPSCSPVPSVPWSLLSSEVQRSFSPLQRFFVAQQKIAGIQS